MGLARLPSLEWHPPCDLSGCFSCRRPPLAPLLRRGAVSRTLRKHEKQKREKANITKCRQKINFGISCHYFSSVFRRLDWRRGGAVQSSVGGSPVGLRHLDSVHAAFSLPPHGCGRHWCSSDSLIAVGTEMAETCCKHGRLFCAMFPCSINPGTEVMGVRAVTVGPVLFWNTMSTSVWWSRWGWFLCRLGSGWLYWAISTAKSELERPCHPQCLDILSSW